MSSPQTTASSGGRPLSQFLWVYSARLLAGGAAFLATVIAAHILGPARFGAFAILLALLNVSGGLVGPALDVAMVRFAARELGKNDDRALLYFRFVFRAKAIVALGLVAAGAVLAKPLANFLLASGDSAATRGVLLAFCGAGILTVWATAQAHFQARQHFGRHALFEGLNAVLRLGGFAVLALAAWRNELAFIAVYGAASLLVAAVAMALIPRNTYLGPIGEGVPGEVMHFAKWVIVACMCTAFSQGLDVFMLSAYGVPREFIGHYRAAVSLVLVGELAVMTLFQVLLPKASQLTTPEDLLRFLRRYQGRTLLAGLALLPALAVADPLCTLVFGQAFSGTGQLFAILLVGTACVLTSAPAGAVVYAGGRSSVIATLEALKLAFIFAIGLWAVPRYGALGMAYTMAAVRGAIAAATYGAARWTITRLPPQP